MQNIPKQRYSQNLQGQTVDFPDERQLAAKLPISTHQQLAV